MRDSRVDQRPVVHYAGMMFCSGPEARLVNEVRDALVAGNVVAAYGSLACGSDVLIAEVVLSLSIELHAVVPCSLHQFRQASVGLGGARWLERSEEDVSQATSLHVEGRDTTPDDTCFAFGDQLAMGAASLRARSDRIPASQVAIWDGVRGNGRAGTGAAVRRWEALDESTQVIHLSRSDVEAVRRSAGDAAPADDLPVEIAVIAAASESHPGEAGRADWSGLPDDGLRLGSSFATVLSSTPGATSVSRSLDAMPESIVGPMFEMAT